LSHTAEVVRMRETAAREGIALHESPGYSGLCNTYQRGITAIARYWINHFASGEGKRILNDALRGGRVVAKVADVRETASAYDAHSNTFRYLIPKEKADRLLALNRTNPTGASTEIAMELFTGGHHEISEAIAALGMGAQEGPHDIVHHTLGLVGQAIGPMLPHPEFGYNTGGSLDDMFRQHQSESNRRDSEGSRLRREVRQIEKAAGEGRFEHERLKTAIEDHRRIYGVHDLDDVESAHLAYRIVEKLRQIPENKRMAAIRRLYSGKMRNRQMLEDFIRKK